ncbi:MAG: DUF11 domain-containing protein [Bryobacteraceae bacterium]|nr:DUF11 domain-containing protein [Bryobacteraceae bacterium]
MSRLQFALLFVAALPSLCFGGALFSPQLDKNFSAPTAPVGVVTVLTFNAVNPNGMASLTNVSFNDPLPPGMAVANPSGITSTCISAVTALPAATNISVTIGNLAGGATCTITVNVVSITPGLKQNVTSPITAANAAPGPAATANITITEPAAFLVSYFPNLNVADSVINVTNPGSDGAGLAAGTTAATTGAICANVYAFSPDEQMVSCCSCPVTPNGLVSLSVQRDLISNTLTPAVPTSIVVKLVATPPVAGSCQGSAAALATFSRSITAWGTKVHAGATPGTLATTEVPFSWGQLSLGEADRLRQLCNFIGSNGSGFGVCRSCRLGGLGAGRL